MTLEDAIDWLWANPLPIADEVTRAIREDIYAQLREMTSLIARQHREFHGKTPAEHHLGH